VTGIKEEREGVVIEKEKRERRGRERRERESERWLSVGI
jgi:hypothetical protein